ncbi:phosphatidate cytidylyltransferase [Phakopsora pachyrhizi]|uniref:Phosphatidate cytidylyltransferase n=1 Tax=Phakopsora pachyrhizi TaxID=170000 RepID=A0AAV0AG10_PHAPC|nr:phosphatidate cytidylyltransferase [Phakopsora pachyrhizi]
MTLGHVYLIVLVFIIQLSVFREVSNLFEVGYKASAREHARKQASAIQAGHQALSLAAKERRRIKDVDKNRWSKVMSWYFFCAVNYFLYGESIIYYFKHVVFIDAYLLPFARHHRFISLLLYLVGFLAFVANLDRGHLRRQFGLFSWIHMSLLLIVASGQFMVNNILEGLIWFWIPASLVIMNDVAAYVFGMLFGKHQLIKLSPKKTVEGFIGGYFTTVIFSVLWGSLFMGWNYMICPVRDLGMTAFSDVQCTPNNAFVWRAYNFPETLVWYTPFQLHCLVLGTFAGLVAPFGGFFASGFKRAFNIKDFADTIPGHGGLTDRFDCQFIMGLFTYFYYTSMVREQHVTIGSILEMIASSLSLNEQYELYQDLGKSLVAQGIKI